MITFRLRFYFYRASKEVQSRLQKEDFHTKKSVCFSTESAIMRHYVDSLNLKYLRCIYKYRKSSIKPPPPPLK